MKKKLLAVFLIVCMALTFIPAGALAVTIGSEEITPNSIISTPGKWLTEIYTVELDAEKDASAIEVLKKLTTDKLVVYNEDGTQEPDVSAIYLSSDSTLRLGFETALAEPAVYYLAITSGDTGSEITEYVEVHVFVPVKSVEITLNTKSIKVNDPLPETVVKAVPENSVTVKTIWTKDGNPVTAAASAGEYTATFTAEAAEGYMLVDGNVYGGTEYKVNNVRVDDTASLTAGVTVSDVAADGLIKLGNPTELSWDASEHGVVHWKPGLMQNRFQLVFYRINNDGGIDEKVYGAFFENEKPTEKKSIPSFIYECTDFNSGTYYFTVQNLGDDIEYSSSGIVSSKDMDGGTYEYIKPDSQLAVPAKGHWEWPAAVWEGTEGQGYTIEYGFSKTKDGEIAFIGCTNNIPYNSSGFTDRWMQEKLIGEKGDGYYYFRTRAITSDITEQRNSELSPWSEGYNLSEASEKVAEELKKLNTDEATKETIVEGIEKLNTTELQNAMRADNPASDNGTVAALTDLENKVGGPAAVVVSDEMAGSFQEAAVKVVGAALNTKSDDDKGITLNIDRAEKKDISETMYNSTVAVNFSMDLDNVEDTENLTVPVKITLPIPSTINPDFLVILHYHKDGTSEEVITNRYQDNGKWFVTFVLTSFSDFVMTQRANTEGSGSENPPEIPDKPVTPPSIGGGSGGGSLTPSNIVTAPSATPNGNIGLSSTSAKQGEIVTVTVTPDSGYELDAITVTDAFGKAIAVTKTADGKYTFTMPATAVRIDATFKKLVSSMPFTDVAGGAWYHDAVSYVYEKGLMNGTADTLFSPDVTTTRGMFVTLLYRLEGEPSAPAPGFTDVAAGKYYSSAVAWATINKIVNGYGDGRFGPEDTITREQMATMLYRYAGYKGYDISADTGLAEFVDAGNVSDYARDAMSWAIAGGLVNGVGGNALAPQGNASRAQLASILMRFCENVAG